MELTDVLGFLDGLGRLGRPSDVAAYAADHVREATGARFAEVVTSAGGAMTVLHTSDAGLTAALMRAREETAGPATPAPGLAGAVVVVDDLAEASPWDAFAALAVERTPVRSAVLPYLMTDARTAVVVPVSDDRPGWFTPQRQVEVRLVSGLTAQTLRGLADAESAAHLRRGLDSRARVGTAVGVLVARRGLTPDAAFDLLRSTSTRSHVRLRELAERVLVDGDLDDDLNSTSGDGGASPRS
jgi:hypothetical protein